MSDSLSAGEYGSVLAKHDGPLGTLINRRHTPSNELRALKALKPDLAQKRAFLTWYTAAVTLSGQAGEILQKHGKPLVLAPRKSEGRYLTHRDGLYVVEREFLGSDEHPAWNLDSLIQKRHIGDAGLPRDVALSIMSMIAGILQTMHSTKLVSPEGEVLLQGIPHLNLKPENVIVSRNWRRMDYEVRLTDHLITMSSRLVEESGVTARLNYSAPDLLREDGYFGLSADIFSCGLLLFKLLEGKDFINKEWSRAAILTYISKQMSDDLRNLKLTDAGDKVSLIIKKCLTLDQYERYSTIAELKDEIDRAIRPKDPIVILTEFLDTPPPPPPPDPETLKKKMDERKRLLKKVVKVCAGVVAVIAIVIASYFGWDWWRKDQLIGKVDDVRIRLQQTARSGCLGLDGGSAVTELLNKARSAATAGRIEEAKSLISQAGSRLTAFDLFCSQYDAVNTEIETAKTKPIEYPQYLKYIASVQNVMQEAVGANVSGEASSATAYLDSAKYIIQNKMTEKLPWACSRADLDSLDSVFNSLNPAQKQLARQFLLQAREACNSTDSAGFFAAISGIESIRTPQPPPPPPQSCQDKLTGLRTKVNSLSRCDSVVRVAQALFDSAQSACIQGDTAAFMQKVTEIANLRCVPPPLQTRDTSIPPRPKCDTLNDKLVKLQALQGVVDGLFTEFKIVASSSPTYSQFRNSVNIASTALNNGDCIKAAFHITNATSLMSDGDRLAARLIAVRKSLSSSNEFSAGCDQQLRSLGGLISKCEWSQVEGLLDKLEKVENRVSRYEAIKSSLSLRKNLPPDCQLKLDSLKRLVAQCNWQGMDALFSYLESRTCSSDTNKIIASADTVVTFDACYKAFKNKVPQAWSMCEKVSADDPSKKRAEAYFLRSLLQESAWRSVTRRRLLEAYQRKVTQACSIDEVECNIVMGMALGWDISGMDPKQAVKYYDSAKSCGNVVEEIPYIWWKMEFVAAQCYYKLWKDNPSVNTKKDARLQFQRYFDYIGNHPDIEPSAKQFTSQVKTFNQDVSKQNTQLR